MPNGCFEVDSVDYSSRGVTRLRADLIPLRDGAPDASEYAPYFSASTASSYRAGAAPYRPSWNSSFGASPAPFEYPSHQ
jgi:hypothetical protein